MEQMITCFYIGKIYTCHCVSGEYFVFDYKGSGEYYDSIDFNFLCSNTHEEYAISNSYLNTTGREIKKPTEFELEYYKYMKSKYYKDGVNDYISNISQQEFEDIVKLIKRKIKLDKI